MKTILRQRPIHKSVEVGKEDYDVYVTRDGTEFCSLKMAEIHEARIIKHEDFVKKYHVREIELSDYRYTLLKIDELTEENKQEIKVKYKNLYVGELRKGINLIHIDDSGDYTCISVYYPEDMISELESDLYVLKGLILMDSIK